MSPSPASKKANVVQFAAAAEGGSSAVAAKIKAKTQFSDDGTSSSAAIAEDRSVKSHYVLNSVIDVALSKDCNNLEEDGPEGKPGDEQPRAASKASKSRMETYKAEWAGAEGAAERPLLPEDVERWREEKARRMVAWINNSQLTGYWGSETPWWKVMLKEVEAAAAAVAAQAVEEGGKIQKDQAADEENEAAAAMLSFFDSLNIVEHADGDGANDPPDSGVAAARARGYR